MSAISYTGADRAGTRRRARGGAGADTRGGTLRVALSETSAWPVRILQVFLVALWVFPSDYVIQTVGNLGYVAGLIGLVAFAVWFLASLSGVHDPRVYRYPIRGALAVFWIVSLISYATINRASMDSHQLLGADRYLMELALMTGLTVTAAEGLHTLHDVRRILRVAVWAATFCAFVAALQYWLSVDLPTVYMRWVPGFQLTDLPGVGIETRGSLNRVTGTAIHPIELGVTCSMLLPLAVYLLVYDTSVRRWLRWVPIIGLLICIATSISRSAIIGTALAMGTLMVLMPLRLRLRAFLGLPVAIGGVFLSAHGLIGTLADFFRNAGHDSSISHRTNNYPYVEALVRHLPWLGSGGGTYIPDELHILDNQYLMTVVELGVLGLLCLILLVVVATSAAFVARRYTRDEELRLLLAALGGAMLAGAVGMATFDAFSFPVFYNMFALLMGLIGVAWRLACSQSPSHLSQSDPSQPQPRSRAEVSTLWAQQPSLQGA